MADFLSCHCDEIFYLPSEVVIHNKPDDCWVSYFGGVYDLTKFCNEADDEDVIKPIIANAGKDISHWFDHGKNDIKYQLDESSGDVVICCPHGKIPNIIFGSKFRPLDKCPWWLDENYKIGNLTINSRPCKIVNTLTSCEVIILVCEEDKISKIQERYLAFNCHASNYIWKFNGKKLDMNKTMTENGMIDERERYTNCGLPENIYVPCIMCYFKDDLTVA
ncbi:hypothetical protein HCN44_004046 [Aphidius gifuensis]|uniref:Cytochrome b5 domain-containing protein 1 n=1 Tax=Aphidius gifuensis TaxID=684658 RepID=A0A835CS40_APHGI|nr:hypothetical protein HCN44_004046 [Aphidius gifuensis]